MDSLKFCDLRVEKANAISKYHMIQRVTTVFRLVELSVFLIIAVRFCSQFHFSVKTSGERFWGIVAALISPSFVFVIGNVIVVVLLLKSGHFSAENGRKGTDFYDVYVEKCRGKHQTSGNGKLGDMEINRSRSERVLGVSHQVEEGRRRELRRSMTERCQGTANNRRRNAVSGAVTSYCAEYEMSSEEFRQTVEAFIARQQRLLREEGKGHFPKYES